MNTVIVPAFHVYYAPQAEIDAVTAWLDAHDAWDVLNYHDISIDNDTLVYEAPCPGFSRNGRTYTRTRPLVAAPPAITSVPRPDLHDLFREHAAAEFPLLAQGFGCLACTVQPEFVPWRCPTLLAALEARPIAA